MNRIGCCIVATLTLVSPAFSEPIGKGVACIPICGDGTPALALARQGKYLILAIDALQKNTPIDNELTEKRGVLVMQNPHRAVEQTADGCRITLDGTKHRTPYYVVEFETR